MDANVINSFMGEYRFLSNFHPCVIEYEGARYATTEHAYQAAKILDPTKREVFTLDFNPNLTPKDARRVGQKVDLRPNWDELKAGVMRDVLILKFAQPDLRDRLLATGDAELIEGNWWHDIFFGVCYGEFKGHVCRFGAHEPVGQSMLGKLLMAYRAGAASK